MIKTYLSKQDKDFLWNHLRDLNNASCQIILKKFEKFHVSEALPLKVFVQTLATFTSIKVRRSASLQEVIETHFANAFEGGALKPQFARSLTRPQDLLRGRSAGPFLSAGACRPGLRLHGPPELPHAQVLNKLNQVHVLFARGTLRRRRCFLGLWPRRPQLRLRSVARGLPLPGRVLRFGRHNGELPFALEVAEDGQEHVVLVSEPGRCPRTK